MHGRLSYLLYNLAKNYAETINGSQRILKFENTKKDIASLLMVANETVIWLMSEMKNEGLINYKGKYLIINDIEELRKATRIDSEELAGR